MDWSIADVNNDGVFDIIADFGKKYEVRPLGVYTGFTPAVREFVFDDPAGGPPDLSFRTIAGGFRQYPIFVDSNAIDTSEYFQRLNNKLFFIYLEDEIEGTGIFCHIDRIDPTMNRKRKPLDLTADTVNTLPFAYCEIRVSIVASDGNTQRLIERKLARTDSEGNIHFRFTAQYYFKGRVFIEVMGKTQMGNVERQAVSGYFELPGFLNRPAQLGQVEIKKTSAFFSELSEHNLNNGRGKKHKNENVAAPIDLNRLQKVDGH